MDNLPNPTVSDKLDRTIDSASWRTRAAIAWTDERARRQRVAEDKQVADAVARQKRRRLLACDLTQALVRVLRVEIVPTVTFGELADVPEGHDVATVRYGSVVLGVGSTSDDLRVWSPCPVCGRYRASRDCATLADVGEMLYGDFVYYSAWDADAHLHPPPPPYRVAVGRRLRALLRRVTGR